MTPYEGNEPYIFISYSHKDTDAVLSVIHALEANGYRVWFDAGVEAGSEWPEYIATHLRKSACILAFISPHFASSLNCKRELTFAQDLNIPMLNVYLEDVQLSDGLRMQLGLNQCLFKNKFGSENDFLNAVCRAELLKSCRTDGAAPTPPPVYHVKEEAKPNESTSTVACPHKRRRNALAWITSIIELSYVLIGIWSIDLITAHVEGGFARFLWMILPHSVVTALSLILYRTLGKGLTKQEKSDASTATAGFWFIATLLAIIGGCFYLNAEVGGFLKFLISLGLNLVPGIISIVMIGCLDE